jgi:hypothetical protein
MTATAAEAAAAATVLAKTTWTREAAMTEQSASIHLLMRAVNIFRTFRSLKTSMKGRRLLIRRSEVYLK